MRVGVTSLAVTMVIGLNLTATADPSAVPQSQDRVSPYMRVFGAAQPPYGHVQFCERMPGECKTGLGGEQRFSADPMRLSELDAVNRQVNREIAPATDMEIYGQTEYWTIPITRGDCEDYALLKRKRLIARGWPVSSLLITVVRDEKGEGHAVLTARTMQGDFILDNKIDEIRVWYRTGYEFIMRQSYLDPRLWMSLDGNEGGGHLPIAGVRNPR